jgi:ribonuclease HI
VNIQQILEAIATLPEPERRDLLARLRELYGTTPAPIPKQIGMALGEWEGPADYLIVFDGGSQGNPGVGYGSYAIFDGARKGQVNRLSFEGQLTNNEAEYHTLLAALRDLQQRLGPRSSEMTVEVRGDSALVIEQVSGKWKAKDERMRQLRDEVRQALNRFKRFRLVQQPREDSVKVLGH